VWHPTSRQHFTKGGIRKGTPLNPSKARSKIYLLMWEYAGDKIKQRSNV
jgi:hypothetical protein